MGGSFYGGGGAGIDLAWTADPADLGAAATVPDGANRGVYVRVVEAPQSGVQIAKLGIGIGTSSGNISLAVYSNTGLGSAAAPSARRATTGAVASPGTGFREFTLDQAVRVMKGDWFFLSADNTTFTAQRGLGSSLNLFPFRSVKQASAHPAPASAGSLVADDRPFIIVGIP